MTRENKIALVIGFALVLFVGIAVSDHLSKARTRSAPDLIPAAHRRAPRADPTPVDLGPARPPPPAGRRAFPAPEQAPPSPAAQAPADAPATSAASPPPEPAARTHRVRPGESLSEICHRYYGDATLAGAVAARNGLADPDLVRAGRQLRLPPRPELGPDGPAGAVAAAGPAPTASPRIHVVQPGETLSGLARRLLGSAARWRRLYELNRDVIADPDEIEAGTRIRIPAAASP